MRRGAAALLAATLCACSPYAYPDAIGWNAEDQIWQAEASQVRVRAAQSRTFDTGDRRAALEAVVSVFQDLGFQVELLDATLGIVSGKKFVDLARPAIEDPSYFLYRPERLVVLQRSQIYRSWGPFRHRTDLVRLTVTLRPKGPAQLVVRASAQLALRPLEDAEPYQHFFRTLEQALFLQGEREG